MALNSTPIYEGVPLIGWAGTGTAANTAKDGTGTTNLVFTAPGSVGDKNGALLLKLVCKSKGTAVATCLRVFVNNGSTPSTAANNTLVAEQSLPAITNSEVTAQLTIPIELLLPLPAGYRVYICVGTAIAAEWQVTAFAYSLEAA